MKKIALVTGASRGFGKGIAIGLSKNGFDLIITAREKREEVLPEFLNQTSLSETKKEIEELGGVCEILYVDHSDSNKNKELIENIIKKHDRIDLLVNNAWSGSKHVVMPYYFTEPFYNQPACIFEDHLSVGVVSNYVLSAYAAKHMVEKGSGMIVNISFYGAKEYMHNVAYGTCKTAVDRMTSDMAKDLAESGVNIFSLYPQTVKTEGMIEYAKYDKNIDLDAMENPAHVGKVIAEIYNDRERHQSGSVIETKNFD